MTDRTRVGIAIVVDADRVLVGERGADQTLAGMAEFPGGKCEPGETTSACAVRECLEETGIAVCPLRLLHECQHNYSHANIDVEFWLCAVETKASASVAQPPFRWVSFAELKTLGFPAANGPVIERLVATDFQL